MDPKDAYKWTFATLSAELEDVELKLEQIAKLNAETQKRKESLLCALSEVGKLSHNTDSAPDEPGVIIDRRPIRIVQACQEVLDHAGHPLSLDDLFKAVVEYGATPKNANSLQATISKSPLFVREKNNWALKEWKEKQRISA